MRIKSTLQMALILAAALPLAAQGGKASAPALQATSAAAQPASPAQSGQASPGAAIPSPAAYLPDDSASFLGLGLSAALERCGAPSSVEALRGEESWQDDVVFAYASGYSLYWFGDRLWQIRFGKGYAGSVYGLFVGDGSDKVLSLLGTPYYQGEGGLVYRLPFRGYPVRLRVVLSASGAVSDLYLYRADF